MSTKKTAIMASFILVITIASANFASAALEWTPLVRIPGLPPTGTVNLSMYLIGLYNFLLSIVGIVAVIMLIIGGMRYITAVGNPTAISSAKEIIMSAITGLVLALLSWVFISTINPDVLYIKKPGSAGITDPGTGAKDLRTALPTTTSLSSCVAPGASNSPITVSGLTVCPCIDKAFVPASAGQNCQTVCAVSNCFVADFKIGFYSLDTDEINSFATAYDRAKAYATHNPGLTNPLVANIENIDMCNLTLAVNAVDYTVAPPGAPVPTYDLDINLAGIPPACGAPFDDIINKTYASPLLNGYQGDIVCNLAPYACFDDETECKKELWSNSIICPVTLRVSWGAVKRYSTKWFKWTIPN